MNGGGTGVPRLDCAGDFTITNALGYTHDGSYYATQPSFLLYAGATTAVNSAGAIINVGGTMTLNSDATVYLYSHPTNGGSALITVKNLMIAGVKGGFYADYNGYAGRVNNTGYGPGGGARQYGGGYGGRGWTNSNGGGMTYGSSNAPADAGSAGGCQLYSNGAGGNGGGLVRIRASQTVTVKGTISANGQDMNNGGGAGAGGGIYLYCRTLDGNTNGVIRANGGNEPTVYAGTPGFGGGGGRVAVWRYRDTSVGLTNVTANAGISSQWGASGPGTVVWGQIPPAGTAICIR